MRIISKKRLREFWEKHADARVSLERWYRITEEASWQKLTDVRQTLGSADQVTVASGCRVVVFNIAGNKYRLVAAIHYNARVVYALKVMTHAEYSKDTWKDEL